MSAMPTREPGYRAGRFFLSPMLGCSARCAFCYIFSFGYRYPQGKQNTYGIQESIDWVIRHPEFVPGRGGSVISIGAWGDPFPPNDDARRSTLDWVRAACSIGNPVQLMSRFVLPSAIVDAVVESIAYDGQLLFSTSLSTVSHAATLEKYADAPDGRLATLVRFRDRGVPVNVMVKPFILGLTDRECPEIIALLKRYAIEVCVVGELYWDDRIQRSTAAVGHLSEGATRIMSVEGEVRHPLDCEPSAPLTSLPNAHLDAFIAEMWEGGIAAFKKSACVNSYVSAVDLGLRDRIEYRGYCVECGICATSTGYRDHRPTTAPAGPTRHNAAVPTATPVDAPALSNGASLTSWAVLRSHALGVLRRWTPPHPEDDVARRVFIDYLRSHADGLSRDSRPAHLTASLIVIDPQESEVLLVLHRKVGRWLQPGGHCELSDHTLADVALREAREETGVHLIQLASDQPMDLDVHDAPCTDVPGVHHYDVRFMGLARRGPGLEGQHEVLAARWFPLSQLPSGLDPGLRRLISRAQELV